MTMRDWIDKTIDGINKNRAALWFNVLQIDILVVALKLPLPMGFISFNRCPQH
jgi:hypothetical protein